MTSTNEAPNQVPVPGDRVPAGRLERPPSDRYAPGAGRSSGPKAGSGSDGGSGDRGADAVASPALRSLVPAVAVGALTAFLLVIVGGVLAERSGLLAIAGIGGAALGLVGANAAVPADGSVPPPLSRGRATSAAVVLALLSVAAGALGTWAYGRFEGGVMDPLSYLWETLGPYVPAEAAIAGLAAAWGAGAGPVRGRG